MPGSSLSNSSRSHEGPSTKDKYCSHHGRGFQCSTISALGLSPPPARPLTPPAAEAFWQQNRSNLHGDTGGCRAGTGPQRPRWKRPDCTFRLRTRAGVRTQEKEEAFDITQGSHVALRRPTAKHDIHASIMCHPWSLVCITSTQSGNAIAAGPSGHIPGVKVVEGALDIVTLTRGPARHLRRTCIHTCCSFELGF